MSIIIPNIIYNMICDSINSPFTSKTLSCMYCMYILNFNVRCLSKIPGFFSSSTAGARELREKQKNAGDEKRWADWKTKKGRTKRKLLMFLRFTELENDFGTWNQVMLGLGMSCGYPPVQPAAPVSATSPGSCGTWK